MKTRVLWSRAYLHVRNVDIAVVSPRIRIEKRLAPPSTHAGLRASVFEVVHDGIVIGSFLCLELRSGWSFEPRLHFLWALIPLETAALLKPCRRQKRVMVAVCLHVVIQVS